MKEKLKQLLERIEAEKKAAWEDKDFEYADFMFEVGHTLKELSLVAVAVNGLRNRSSNEDAWTALTDAFAECGLLIED